MKTLFNIKCNNSQATSTARLIEISEEQVAFVYYSISPIEVQQIKLFSFDKQQGFAKIADDLSANFKIENAEHPQINSNNIYVNYKELTLVPASLHKKENNAEILNFIFGADNNVFIQNDNLTESDISLVYRLPAEIMAATGACYPAINIHHSLYKQLKKVENTAGHLICMVGYSYAKIFIYKEGQLLLQRYFAYNTAEDMAYELLNSCVQLNIEVNEVALKLSGFIEVSSNLYDVLHKYFLNIEFENVAENLLLNTDTENYPPHLFYPLFQLLPNENH